MFDDYESFDGNYLDTPPFLLYADAIRRMLAGSPLGLTIREIHRKLGDAAMTHWTMDALASIKGISEHGVVITHYSIRTVEHTPPPSDQTNDTKDRRNSNDWVGGGTQMICPKCGHEESKVIDSRFQDEKGRTWRRRTCCKCWKTYTTFELTEERFDELLRAEQFTVRLGAFLDDIAKMNPTSAKTAARTVRTKGAAR